MKVIVFFQWNITILIKINCNCKELYSDIQEAPYPLDNATPVFPYRFLKSFSARLQRNETILQPLAYPRSWFISALCGRMRNHDLPFVASQFENILPEILHSWNRRPSFPLPPNPFLVAKTLLNFAKICWQIIFYLVGPKKWINFWEIPKFHGKFP